MTGNLPHRSEDMDCFVPSKPHFWLACKRMTCSLSRLLCLSLPLLAYVLYGATTIAVSAADAPRYETDVVPIFKANCVRCHGADASKAELDLSSPLGLFRGGESGESIVPGDAEGSLLFEYIHDGLMPPEQDKRLTEKEVHTIREWIASGAPFVKPVDLTELAAAGQVNNHDIEPLMLLRCAYCHGLRKQEAGLDLRTKASILQGGKSGPAMILGKPEESLLLKRIHAGEMPPNEQLILAGVKPISSSEIEKLTRWIELGAPEVHMEPDVATSEPDTLVTDEDRQFWSFQPPRDVAMPKMDHATMANPIDAFVGRKLEELGFGFAEPATKTALLRRATFDLTGLPPTAAEIEAFLSDDAPLAYERALDRLLASPRYGERWARFWLDAAGYADSEGKRSADPIRPHAYKYRDYLIRSFNVDKPYDRLLHEQLAGDELADYENAPEMTQELVDNLIATGFLRMAPDGTGSDVVNFVPERMEVIADEMDVLGSTVMGLTIKCARCHSHKYDPIPQRDYYRLVAVFKGALDEHDWLKPAFVPGQTKVTKAGRVLPFATKEELRALTRRNQQIDLDIAQHRAGLAELAASIRQEHLDEQLLQLPPALHADLRTAFGTPMEQRDDGQQQLFAKYQKKLWLSDKALKSHQKYKRAKVEADRLIKSLESEKDDQPQIRALWDRGTPSPTYIYRRGDYMQPARLVGPGVPSVLTDGKTPFTVVPPWPGAQKTGRRLALANWLTQPDHPLTARVMVNRIWKHHFGRGIVSSVDNFGQLGTPPSHPDLLDWLARRFVQDRWSIKSIHRLIMTAAVYRQSSVVNQEKLNADPENQWLARMPLRRLEAEQVRDSLLFVAGMLDERPFGRPDAVKVRGDGLVTSIGVDGSWRRSIFVRHRRKEMPTVLETFDLPQMNPACQQRPTSTVAQQALFLMNSTAVRELSDDFASRISLRTSDRSEQVEYCYLTALGRSPSDEERLLAMSALASLTEEWRDKIEAGEPAAAAAERALGVFCHTLMNSAEFLYVD